MPRPKSSSAKPVIRRARRADFPAWLGLRRTLWPDCPAAMHRYEMAKLVRPGRNQTVLMLDLGDGRPGGFIELSVRARVDGSMSDRVGYVEGWYVIPELRGRGWGRRLVAAAEKWTAERGLTELASDAELHNPGGIAAHKAAGFRETFRVVQFLKKIRLRSR